MDIFIEHMVKRKKSVYDIIMAFMFVIIGLCLVYFSLCFQFLPSVIMCLLIAAIIYLTYKFVVHINMEYEYILTNNDLTVDKIINKRSRKEVETVNIRLIQYFGLCGDIQESKYLEDKEYKKIIACENVKEGYAFMAYIKDNKKKVLFFTPNEEIIKQIRKVNLGKFQ